MLVNQHLNMNLLKMILKSKMNQKLCLHNKVFQVRNSYL